MTEPVDDAAPGDLDDSPRRGRLVLVATPIGNLGDLSPRGVEALARADVIACEDTRRTGRLLHHFGISGPRLMVVNDHTERAQTAEVVRHLDQGRTVAVVSDAGTPGISDPGERLVKAALAAGHDVSSLPGPSAALAALVISGLAANRFAFEGFLPRRGSGRTERLAALAGEQRTIVLYESPHRLARTLTDLAALLGSDREVSVARELTKLHEETWRGTLAEALVRWVDEGHEPRGEYVLVVAGAPERPIEASDVDEALSAALGRGASVRDAATEVASALGVGKRAVYDRALQLHRA